MWLSDSPAVQPEDPFAEKQVIKDGWFNQVMIKYFASKVRLGAASTCPLCSSSCAHI